VTRSALIALCLVLSSCAWYKANQERSAVIEVRQAIQQFQKKHNAKPLVLAGKIEPCLWDLATPLPAISTYEVTHGAYKPFVGDMGQILYPEGDYDSLRHELVHHYNWRTPISWRCLDEYAASRLATDSRYMTPRTSAEKRHYASKFSRAKW